MDDAFFLQFRLNDNAILCMCVGYAIYVTGEGGPNLHVIPFGAAHSR